MKKKNANGRDWRVVKRPEFKMRQHGLAAALRATLNTGEVVRLPRAKELGGYHGVFMREGWKLRQHCEGEWRYAWLEPLDGTRRTT